MLRLIVDQVHQFKLSLLGTHDAPVDYKPYDQGGNERTCAKKPPGPIPRKENDKGELRPVFAPFAIAVFHLNFKLIRSRSQVCKLQFPFGCFRPR